MKVLLISANTEQINMPTLPLGLACVAAATRKAGHEVAYLDLMAQDDVQKVIKEAMEERSPDVVGISVRNIDDQVMDNPAFLLEQVKKVVASCRSFSNAPIVLGGAGYSMYPESALEYLGADRGSREKGKWPSPPFWTRSSETMTFQTRQVFISRAGAFKPRELLRKIWTGSLSLKITSGPRLLSLETRNFCCRSRPDAAAP